MKKVICCLLALVMVLMLASCGGETKTVTPEEPDLLPQLEAYIATKTKELQQQFGMEDLEIIPEAIRDTTISVTKPRGQETDVGEYTVRLYYYISAPGFIADILARQGDRNLNYDDIVLGEELMHGFTLDDFVVENYEISRASVCTCRAIIGSEAYTELTFETDPIGDFGYGEIIKRWNLDKDAYDWDMIFYYNDKLERIYYSNAEYDEHALPPDIDSRSYCVKCGNYTLVTAGGYCGTCVKIYKSEWYIDWNGEVRID